MSFEDAPFTLTWLTLAQVDIPQGRKRKHQLIVSTILRDRDQLKDGAALKVPLADMSETKENVRSALNRAS
jgi:hypothetical protein